MDEVIEMGQEDLRRHHIVRSALERQITQAEAARSLRLSVRQVKRICAKVRASGARGVLHGLKGQPSNHQPNTLAQERALCALHSTRWEGFGPTFAQEKLEAMCGVRIGRETLRQLMIQADLWQPRRPRARHRIWRPRRPCLGMMVQLDGSDHDWFEGRGPRCVLIVFIDDATSRILYAAFAKVEDTLTLLRAAGAYLKRWGRPLSLYVDKDGIYRINQALKDGGAWRDELPMTQFGRAMAELGIEVIFADSPQAKGRVERGFDTHQDRLVKELRLKNISTIEDANRYLRDGYIDAHNARFAVEAAQSGDAHRPLSAAYRLEEILSIRIERTLLNDYTLRNDSKFYQVLKEQTIVVRPKDKIEVETRLNGSIHLRGKGVYLNYRQIDKPAYRPLALPKLHYRPEAKPNGARPGKKHPWRSFVLGKASLAWYERTARTE